MGDPTIGTNNRSMGGLLPLAAITPGFVGLLAGVLWAIAAATGGAETEEHQHR